MDSKEKKKKRDWGVFIGSIFFVAGFSLVFALIGVLLETIFSGFQFAAQLWINRIAGTIIIILGIFLTGLIPLPRFMLKERRFNAKIFKSKYLTALFMGAAFGLAWTPCIGPILGAVITLASIQPINSYFLLLSFSLGLGIPFLVIGFFANQSQSVIRKLGPKLKYINRGFGVVLIILGIFIFSGLLGWIVNIPILVNFLIRLDFFGLGVEGSLNLLIAFIAGIVSFLSPCVLPIIPGFLAYLGSAVTDSNGEKSN